MIEMSKAQQLIDAFGKSGKKLPPAVSVHLDEYDYDYSYSYTEDVDGERTQTQRTLVPLALVSTTSTTGAQVRSGASRSYAQQMHAAHEAEVAHREQSESDSAREGAAAARPGAKANADRAALVLLEKARRER